MEEAYTHIRDTEVGSLPFSFSIWNTVTSAWITACFTRSSRIRFQNLAKYLWDSWIIQFAIVPCFNGTPRRIPLLLLPI